MKYKLIRLVKNRIIIVLGVFMFLLGFAGSIALSIAAIQGVFDVALQQWFAGSVISMALGQCIVITRIV